MARSSWWLVVCLALGSAALVLAWMPSAWPNPLAPASGESRVDPVRAQPVLQPFAAAVDAACRAGDRGAFAAATTAGYRRDLEQRLQVVDGALDAAALQAMAVSSSCERYLRLPMLAVAVAGPRTAVAVQREKGTGAQILTFYWHGSGYQLDGLRHAPRVQSVAAAERYLRALLR